MKIAGNTENTLKVIETHSGYTFSGWLLGNTDITSLLSDETYIKDRASVKEEPIVYTAKLTAGT